MAETIQEETESGNAYTRVALGIGVILVLAVVAAVMVVRYANAEHRRDLRNWEIRLGITADIRASNVEKWVQQQKKELQSTAENLSLQLYMTELNFNRSDEERLAGEAAETEYLRNYIIDTARKSGFLDITASQSGIRANVDIQGSSGIALLDNLGNVIVATAGMPDITSGELATWRKQAPKAQTVMKDIYLDGKKKPAIAFMIPIFAVQGERIPSQQMGTVIGIRAVEPLYQLLKEPPSIEKTAETLLVREGGAGIEYISPLRDGTAPLGLSLAKSKVLHALAGQFVLLQSNAFGIMSDYRSETVLVTGRLIKETGWVLMHKINRQEALGESDERRASLISIALLVIVMLVIMILAVWRHGSSVRYRKLANIFKSQERLLSLVTDNQPDAMFILDKDYRYCFSNRKAAQESGLAKDDMAGKKLRNVLGTAIAQEYATVMDHVLKEGSKVSHVRKVEDEQGVVQKVVQSNYIPMQRVPLVLTGEETPGVLVVEQDITAVISEREKRERILRQLVDSILLLVDRRDTHTASHSMRVAKVAEAIAYEMRLDELSVETIRTAAKLMNLGKILLPINLLTKKGKLTDKERKDIDKAVASTADFLETIEFNGPVVETIRQAQEHWDGSGVLGLKGENIMVTARVIAIANDFVAMTSSRAWRKELDTSRVVDQLMEEIGKKYQRNVVIALVNYLDNRKRENEEDGSE